jgi:hypothetical protein
MAECDMQNGHSLAGLTMLASMLIMVDAVNLAQTSTQQALGSATDLKCVFSLYATGTWRENTPEAEVKTAKLVLEFNSIDTQDGTAIAKGGGPPHIVVRMSRGYLHLLQIASEGPVYLTTVFDQENPGRKFKAVHTRHEYTQVSLPGFTSRPEQYYGECEMLK